MEKLKKEKKILLIDDDEIYLTIAESILKDEYEVITAKSGEEAVEYLLTGVIPNLILLDIIMPNMDGWGTFNKLKAISFLQNVPIAFITSLYGAADKKQAFDMGAVDFIVKPYKQDDLLKRVKNIIDKKDTLPKPQSH